MRSTRDLLLIFVFVLCGSLAAVSQAPSPESALEELATTDKLDVLARHLPLAIEEDIARLNTVEKTALEEQIVVPHRLARSGQSLRKREDGSGWEFQTGPQQPPELIHVKTTFYSGVDALVLLEAQNQEASVALVTMRYENQEWRVIDFGFAQMEGVEARLGARVRPGAQQEAEIIKVLEVLVTALQEYAGIFPEIGFPATLIVLGSSPDATPAPASMANDMNEQSHEANEQSENELAPQRPPSDHAGLLDSSYGVDPLMLHGYRFRYTLIAGASGNEEHYTPGRFSITASPTESGTSSRNFFIDENRVIHFTDENREATMSDPLLQRQYGYRY